MAARLGAGSSGAADSAKVSGGGISPLLLGGFTWYSRRYLRRHFHSLRISRSGCLPKAKGFPLVVYSNHASWFDPLVGLVLKAHCYPQRNLFVPMDATALARYGFFRKLGFFPVEQNHRRGAVQFLRGAEMILKSEQSLLAVTPQGRFADVRERPVKFAGGLGLLASRVERAVFVPLAMEYVFWEERLPEILVRFGMPTTIGSGSGQHSAHKWTAFFEARLQENQDALAIESQRREASEFENILRGDAGQGGVYDWWRSLRAKLRGEVFHMEHGNR
ncbi:MAG: lysophospholipid acyltransferase family protein [Verrucomicrobiota bacterium]